MLKTCFWCPMVLCLADCIQSSWNRRTGYYNPFTFVANFKFTCMGKDRTCIVDIDPKNLCMDASKNRKAITPETTAIVPVHVFGKSGDIDSIEAIAQKNGLKTIYDGAMLLEDYRGKSILSYGDASTLCLC
ncbi:MAG: DegT/DnrJ/EryC1/StrS family aminotransferase [Methanolobus sp.]